jgi:uncharacterized protein YeeX (DUF496 family)
MEKEQRSGTNKLLLILLLLSIIFNIYQLRDGRKAEAQNAVEVDSLVTARVDVEKTLNDTYTELNQYKGINTKLDSLLQEANSKVDEQRDKIEVLLKQESTQKLQSGRLQEEMENLKKLRDDYLEKVDALLVENEKLKREKDDLSTTVASLTQNLETTVSTAAVLKSEYFTTTVFHKKGENRYTPTIVAKRTNKFKTCFTLLENTIAHDGERTVYLRIIEPGGKVLGDRSSGSSTFRKSGSEEDLLYTSSTRIEYKNERTSICLEWEDNITPFSKGIYQLEVYVDGMLSGTSSVTLH